MLEGGVLHCSRNHRQLDHRFSLTSLESLLNPTLNQPVSNSENLFHLDLRDTLDKHNRHRLLQYLRILL
jgi:hypothetical protein